MCQKFRIIIVKTCLFLGIIAENILDKIFTVEKNTGKFAYVNINNIITRGKR